MGWIHWLEHHMLRCPYKALIGMDCPGCGMQRAFVALLNGNFRESLQLYPALIPVIFTLLLTFIHLIFKLKSGAVFIKYSYVVTIAIMMISYVLKMWH